MSSESNALHSPAPGAVGSPYRVLVVDDSPELVRLMRRMLGAGRYTIVEADSAEQAVIRIQGSPQRFDLVISDIVMPGTDGYELATQIREQVGALVLMSGSEVDLARLPPGVGFIAKPFTAQQLRDFVARTLDPGGAQGW
ncbi:MAG: response regulator [Thermoleophilia bacterium]|nr:response regulator [Thermoleophilia bacterium]